MMNEEEGGDLERKKEEEVVATNEEIEGIQRSNSEENVCYTLLLDLHVVPVEIYRRSTYLPTSRSTRVDVPVVPVLLDLYYLDLPPVDLDLLDLVRI